MNTSGGFRAFLVAGTHSGAGKTSVSLGLCRSLARRGTAVQPFKIGPDYIDPAFLTRAAGREAQNLDGWMMGLPYCARRFAALSQTAEVALVEGVMGLYDGAEAGGLAGSSAEMAITLSLPIVLVVDAASMARSIAAVVKGFCELEDGVRIVGVIANRCGSERHAEILREALACAGLPPLLGAVPKNAFPKLADRHLGLVQACETAELAATLDQLADVCEQRINIPKLMQLCQTPRPAMPLDEQAKPVTASLRIGIACDSAFSFYYPDNLDALREVGAELVPFSPLMDTALPERLDALLIGGGYPEIVAEKLAANAAMRDAVKSFADRGGHVYAECGGLMYLSRSLRMPSGESFPMCGVVPANVVLREKRARLGLAEVTLRRDGPWGTAGTKLRGHEFHYSEICGWLEPAWESLYDVQYRRGEIAAEGYWSGPVLAGYVHLHWASRPGCVRRFVEWCKS